MYVSNTQEFVYVPVTMCTLSKIFYVHIYV